jgi:hypothetical protein
LKVVELYQDGKMQEERKIPSHGLSRDFNVIEN